MKGIIIGQLCVILFLACSTKGIRLQKQISDCNDCQTYKEYMKVNWKRDSTGYYYFANPPSCDTPAYLKSGSRYTDFLGNKCFKGMSKDSVMLILGVPTKESPNRMDYYMNSRCNGKEGYDGRIDGCRRLPLYFDARGIIVGVSGITTE